MAEEFSKEKKPRNLREQLQGKLSEKELKQLVSGFDVIGGIALLEIPKALEKKEKLIAKAVMSLHKNIKTVCKKKGKVSGKYRVRKIKVIAGEKTTETMHRESGCEFKVDIAKAFFSPRLGGERLRVAGQIKSGETIGAFFAGIGSFPVVFAKNSPMKKAFAIELNKKAVKFMRENISLNKMHDKIEVFSGDVKKLAKKISGECDRIVMPMPLGGETFLKAAFVAAKQKAVIHFYHFVEKEKGFEQAIQIIEKACKKHGIKFRVLSVRRVVDYSPSRMEVVVDFQIKKQNKANL